jgi:hypothetical protein
VCLWVVFCVVVWLCGCMVVGCGLWVAGCVVVGLCDWVGEFFFNA